MMSIEPRLEELSVFPCGADKRPACPGGFKSAVAGPDRIDDLFRQYPGALVGAPTGCASGFDVLDIDRGGEDWLATYDATYGLPATRIVATRSGGLHIYFRHYIGMKCSAGLLAPNVDIRSTGGYVILWDQAGLPVLSSAEIAPWPGPMLELLDEAMEARSRRVRAPAGMRFPFEMDGTLWGKARHYRELPRALYFRMHELIGSSLGRSRAHGLLLVLINKTEGRNHALNTLGFPFRELIAADAISWDGAKELLIVGATINGYIQKRGLARAIRTIHSALGPRS